MKQTAEQILDKHLAVIHNDHPSEYIPQDEMKSLPEYKAMLLAMEEYASQPQDQQGEDSVMYREGLLKIIEFHETRTQVAIPLRDVLIDQISLFTPPETQPVNNNRMQELLQSISEAEKHDLLNNLTDYFKGCRDGVKAGCKTQPVSVSEEITDLDGYNHYNNEAEAEAFQEGVDCVIEILSTTQPTKIDEGWISVEDRIPKSGENE